MRIVGLWTLAVVLPALFALLTLLTWNMAPTGPLWMLKIALTELGLVLVPLAVLSILVATVALTGSVRIWSVLLLSIALGNLLWPGLAASRVARAHGLPLWPFNSDTTGTSDAPETMTYQESSGEIRKLDFYRPKLGEGPDKTAPLVITVHGGSWKGGDRSQFRWFNHALAKRGIAVAAVDYSLAPNFRFPVPVADVTAAVVYLRSRAAELGVDADRFMLLGRSAGGQIALSVAYSMPGIAAVAAIYSPADLVWGWENSKPWHIIDGRAVIEDYLGAAPAADPQIYFNASPVRHVRPDSPPTLLIHGTHDEMVGFEHTRRMTAALQGAGVNHEVIALQWATHGFDHFRHGPGAAIALDAVVRFFAATGRVANPLP